MKATTDRPTFVKIDLEQPIARGEDKIAELQLRRPDAGSLRGISLIDLVKMQPTAIAALLPRISTPPLIEAEIDGLDPADLFACGVEIAGFFMTKAELQSSPTT